MCVVLKVRTLSFLLIKTWYKEDKVCKQIETNWTNAGWQLMKTDKMKQKEFSGEEETF